MFRLFKAELAIIKIINIYNNLRYENKRYSFR